MVIFFPKLKYAVNSLFQKWKKYVNFFSIDINFISTFSCFIFKLKKNVFFNFVDHHVVVVRHVVEDHYVVVVRHVVVDQHGVVNRHHLVVVVDHHHLVVVVADHHHLVVSLR